MSTVSAPEQASPSPILTRRLRLRRLTRDDAPFMLRLLNEPSFHRNIGDKGVRSLDDARRYLDGGPLASYQRNGFGLYLVEGADDGVPMGMCGLIKRDTLDDVDIGYALVPEFWGAGHAEEACRATLAHARDDFGLRRVVAIVSPGNAASTRVLEKLGFTYERDLQLGDHDDVVQLYGVSLGED